MKRITLKNGQRIRLYCDCDQNFEEAMGKGAHLVLTRLKPEKYAGICSKCQFYPWTYSKVK